MSIRIYRRNGDGLRDVCCSLFPPDASVLFRVKWHCIRWTLEQSRMGGRTYASNAFTQDSCNRLVTLRSTAQQCSGCFICPIPCYFRESAFKWDLSHCWEGKNGIKIENPNLFSFSFLSSPLQFNYTVFFHDILTHTTFDYCLSVLITLYNKSFWEDCRQDKF